MTYFGTLTIVGKALYAVAALNIFVLLAGIGNWLYGVPPGSEMLGSLVMAFSCAYATRFFHKEKGH